MKLTKRNTRITRVDNYASNSQVWLEHGEDTYLLSCEHTGDEQRARWSGGYGNPDDISISLLKECCKRGGVRLTDFF